jgi:GNAT superfamily N-acetyltransferase
MSHKPTATCGSTIRPATSGDIDAIVDLCEEFNTYIAGITGRSAKPADRSALAANVQRGLQDPGKLFLVADQEGRVSGYITGGVVGSLGRIGIVMVTASARGTGLGRRLLVAIEAWLSQRGCTRIELLGILPENPTVGFYQRHGYILDGGTMKKDL